jgi:phage shock protein PspC (stress-responsive transcriptional regulator)
MADRTRILSSKGIGWGVSPRKTSGGAGRSGSEWVIFPRRDDVSPADDEVMETSSIPPQDDACDGATAGNRAGQRTLRRPAQDRVFAGVGAGVADYLGTDVTATRVGLAAVAVLAHVAIPVYVVGWALIPEQGKSRSRAAEFLDSVTTRVRQA